MQVKLITETSASEELIAALEEQDGVTVEGSSDGKDLTEQAFGLAEIGIVITIVKGAVELAGALWKFARRNSSQGSRIVLQTAVGSAEIELSEDLSPEDLRTLVEPLFAVG